MSMAARVAARYLMADAWGRSSLETLQRYFGNLFPESKRTPRGPVMRPGDLGALKKSFEDRLEPIFYEAVLTADWGWEPDGESEGTGEAPVSAVKPTRYDPGDDVMEDFEYTYPREMAGTMLVRIPRSVIEREILLAVQRVARRAPLTQIKEAVNNLLDRDEKLLEGIATRAGTRAWNKIPWEIEWDTVIDKAGEKINAPYLDLDASKYEWKTEFPKPSSDISKIGDIIASPQGVEISLVASIGLELNLDGQEFSRDY